MCQNQANACVYTEDTETQREFEACLQEPDTADASTAVTSRSFQHVSCCCCSDANLEADFKQTLVRGKLSKKFRELGNERGLLDPIPERFVETGRIPVAQNAIGNTAITNPQNTR